MLLEALNDHWRFQDETGKVIWAFGFLNAACIADDAFEILRLLYGI